MFKRKTETNFVLCLVQHLFTDLLTPWSTVLLQKLTGFQLVKEFPAFYGTRRFITWRRGAESRDEWRHALREAKARKGLYRHTWNGIKGFTSVCHLSLS